MRKIIKFNQNWRFVKQAENADTACKAQGEPVTLPHTWNAVDGQDGGNDYYRGTCWYVRNLTKAELLDEAVNCQNTSEGLEDKEVWLEFDGAAMTAEVYFNGEKIARHEGGYSTFRVNLTEYLQKENQLAVSVDNSDNDRVYPQKADFTFYGGIYRDVRILIVEKAHFALGYAGGQGIKVTPKVNGADAKVTVEAWTEGPAEAVRFTVNGQNVEAEVTDGYVKAELILENVHLWNGVEDPYLYTLQAEVIGQTDAVLSGTDESCDEIENKVITDQIEVRFGCRTIEIDPEKGFFLNGRSYPLRGVSRHQDRAGVGNALTQEMHREDMEMIQEIGANTIRLAHYQHSQFFYDLCDETGMIVWAEIPYITMHMPNGRENTLSQMKELVVQNYNHPSIVCWGLSNEITAATCSVSDDMMENHVLLNDLCHELDTTRPTTMAHVFMLETDNKIIEVPDIGSYNLYFGWYLGELEQNDSFFDEYHKKYPNRCIGFSEYGADANPTYQSSRPDRGDYSESYQAVYHEHMIEMIEKRPYLWATHVWNMFDFAADGRDEGGKHGENQKGLVTMNRKVKKDAFYLYKAHWSKEPFVHLCGSRYADRAEEVTEVKVYSNQPQVELYMDGVRAGEMSGSCVFRFEVRISGEHVIEARAGECIDKMQIRKTPEPNPAYLFHKQAIINWFEEEQINPDCYSIYDTLGEIQQSPQGAALYGKLMEKTSASRGDVAESVKDNANLQRMMARQTLQSLLKHVGDLISQEEVKALNDALQQIPKV